MPYQFYCINDNINHAKNFSALQLHFVLESALNVDRVSGQNHLEAMDLIQQ